MDPKRSLSPNPAKRPGPGTGNTPVPPGRGPAPGISEAIDRLGRDIQQLRVDFERFFNGALPFPPEELRNRIQAQLRQLRNANLSTAVDNFRLGDVEARFNSYNELFNRRLRDREEGRHPQAALPAPPSSRRYDPEKGILVGDRIDPEAAEALYHGLASGPGDSPKFDLDSFQTYLVKQAAAIRAKTGCSEVQFRLAVEDGKTKLKARPVQGSQGD
ncbi:MAG TPA: MXAN_5187 C-terminal domain-containing protein [Thermoanaerobaculia bacterium]|nr:MXAN_5187 C-terminal domain-containing protein [Thermoanaerobaculia bacterium]